MIGKREHGSGIQAIRGYPQQFSNMPGSIDDGIAKIGIWGKIIGWGRGVKIIS
jgi:hypothetical protein